jgi:hypothetical protein
MLTRTVLVVGATAGLVLGALAVAPAQATTRGVVTGTVTDAAGRPVEGAVVDYHELYGDHDTATTDAHGVYRLRERAPSHAYLDVYDQSDYPVWTSGDLGFEPGDTLVRDVAIAPAGVSTVLYGRVTDARTGRPIARLHLRSYLHEEDNDGDAWTDRDGRYAFTEYDGQGEGYRPLADTCSPLLGGCTLDLFTDPTSKYAAVSYDEEDAGGAGPGVELEEGQRVRFDFTVPRISPE